MNLIKQLNRFLPSVDTANLPVMVRPADNPFSTLGNGMSLYPHGKDETYIRKGYNGNAWVYAIVSKCAKKFAQVPWYHYRIKNSERKTWAEYTQLTKDRRLDVKGIIEAKKMRLKSVDQVVVDDDISKLLAKPNRNQSGAQFREQLYGYKLLTGEGDMWLSRPTGKNGEPDNSKPPKEKFIIPKQNLVLVGGADPWAISEYKLVFGGKEFGNSPRNIIMWKFPSYDFNPNTLSHLRGQAPLDAGMLLLQSSNEGQERLARMNANQGVAGLTYRKDDNGMKQMPTPEQAYFTRQQFNAIINDKDLAGSIAYMTGDYGFIQYGMTAEQLQLLEQLDKSIEWFCNIFDYPPGLMTKNQTHENQRQQERAFIYGNIAPAAYGLRDELNAKLIPEFALDRDRDVIDCDLLSLPELAEDMQTQANTVGKLWQLTPNQVLEYLGYEKSEDPNMDKVYVPSGLTSLDDINTPVGGGLDNEINLLEGN